MDFENKSGSAAGSPFSKTTTEHTGSIGYDALMEMYDESKNASGGIQAGTSLGAYLGNEFDLSANQLKYITPIDNTGLEMLSRKLGIDLDTVRNVYADTITGASLSAGESLNEARRNMENRLVSSGLATGGSETFRAQTSEDLLRKATGQDITAARTGKEIYELKQRLTRHQSSMKSKGS